MDRLKRYFSYLICSFKCLLSWLLLNTVYRKLYKLDIWLFSEKHVEARDNAYHLYKYVKIEHPEINAYYSIIKGSPDETKILQYGDTINGDSLMHYMYWMAAKYSIGSQLYGASPYPTHWNYRLRGFCRNDQKVIYLKHGIYKDELPHDLDYPRTRFSLICCAAEKERNFIIRTYGYPSNIVQLLGLCRFDNLFSKYQAKKLILIMPTFREYLVASKRELPADQKECRKFIRSSFYINYYSLLKNEDLINAAHQMGYKIIYYMHYSFQSYTRVFADCSNEIITIADREHYDVQQLLIDSSIMVTDFSSVFFDFAYLRKPEIYFQFDEEDYRKMHYKKGYFDYRRDGFGPVFMKTDEVVKYLIFLMNTNCKMESMYLDRVNSFFEFNDKHNCERTYNAITQL